MPRGWSCHPTTTGAAATAAVGARHSSFAAWAKRAAHVAALTGGAGPKTGVAGSRAGAVPLRDRACHWTLLQYLGHYVYVHPGDRAWACVQDLQPQPWLVQQQQREGQGQQGASARVGIAAAAASSGPAALPTPADGQARARGWVPLREVTTAQVGRVGRGGGGGARRGALPASS